MAFLVVIGLTAWITSNRSTDASSSAPSWLFSLSSDAGSMKKNADGSYLLTLTGADDAITAFTDRPVRDTAVVPLGRAVIAWPQVLHPRHLMLCWSSTILQALALPLLLYSPIRSY